MNFPTTNLSIASWCPATWDHIVGNKYPKRYLKQLVSDFKPKIEAKTMIENRPNVLLEGDSRTGKSILIKHFVRCLYCEDFDKVNLNPCNFTCPPCSRHVATYGEHGLFRAASLPVHLMRIDCTKIQTAQQLTKQLDYTGWVDYTDDLKIVWLEEVHRLATKNHLEEMLLTDLDDAPHLWICTTAKPEGLDPYFLGRFSRIITTPPSQKELISWLIGRCCQWNINFDPVAIAQLADKCAGIPGRAMPVLAQAKAFADTGLSLELVGNQHFGP